MERDTGDYSHLFLLSTVIPVLTREKEDVVTSYDKEKYCDLLLDAAETVLGYFGFDGSVYRKSENRGIKSSNRSGGMN